MNRRKRKTLHHFFKAVRSGQSESVLSSAWRSSVMAEVSRIARKEAPSDFERLAPRFALAATALSLAVLAAASGTLADLPETVSTAITNRFYDVTPTLWSIL